MIGRLLGTAAVASLLVTPVRAQDANFPCKVLLCSQPDWPAIPYCVPIMEQAAFLGAMGIPVGACPEALIPSQLPSSANSPTN